jgi:CheY-like chemotaxis protein/HPt (histidine-containing phosphotransfer) domain-containing protein
VVVLRYKLRDLGLLYSEALAEQEEQVPLQKIKVLIAEDNQMNQQLVRHLMKSWSLDHLLVNTGAEAVDELTKNSYSIVLMDIQMPDMDGYTATSIIRNELKLDVPIIAMTAHAMVGEKEKCLQLGMNDYVSKPIKETVLYNIIARHAQNIHEKTEEINHVDLNYLHQLSGNDKDFERDILNQFLEQVPSELSQLEKSIKEDDFETIRRTAHSLKSTVGYVGLAKDLHPYLEEMERDAVDQDAARFESNYNHVKSKCDFALDSVKTLLDKGLL